MAARREMRTEAVRNPAPTKKMPNCLRDRGEKKVDWFDGDVSMPRACELAAAAGLVVAVGRVAIAAVDAIGWRESVAVALEDNWRAAGFSGGGGDRASPAADDEPKSQEKRDMGASIAT